MVRVILLLMLGRLIGCAHRAIVRRRRISTGGGCGLIRRHRTIGLVMPGRCLVRRRVFLRAGLILTGRIAVRALIILVVVLVAIVVIAARTVTVRIVAAIVLAVLILTVLTMMFPGWSRADAAGVRESRSRGPCAHW